jgi:regulator of sigma E protease
MTHQFQSFADGIGRTEKMEDKYFIEAYNLIFHKKSGNSNSSCQRVYMSDFLSTVFSYILSVGAVLLLFGATVLVHEWGHFITAKHFGLRIDAFSIGMGPALWKKKVGGVLYKISLLPIGGYVALPQMDITGSAFENEDAAEGKLEPVDPWKRIVIALAGPFMNVVAALVLCTIVWVVGKPADPGPGPAKIGRVSEFSPAYEAGLRAGDLVRNINGDQIHFWQDLQISAMLSENLNMQLTRDGEVVRLYDIPTSVNSMGFLQLQGVAPVDSDLLYVGVHQVSPGSAADRAGVQVGDRLLEVNGTEITDGMVFIEAVQAAEGAELDLRVQSKGSTSPKQISVAPEWNEDMERWLVGITMQGEFKKVHPPPLRQIHYFQGSIFRTLKAFTRPREMGKAAQGVGGPVMILSGMHSQVKFHPMQALWFTALININLAIINLLPLIILDGGHIMVALFEWITGKKPYRRLIVGLANVMVVVLIALMILLSIRDVSLLKRIYGESDSPAAEETSPSEDTESESETP